MATRNNIMLNFDSMNCRKPNQQNTSGPVSGVQVTNLPVNLLSLIVTNVSADGFWLQMFDTSAIPVDGTSVDYPPVFVPGSADSVIRTITMNQPLLFKNGLSLVASSTPTAKTALGGGPMMAAYQIFVISIEHVWNGN